jgi:Pyrimidine dimer DNA glycosylase
MQTFIPHKSFRDCAQALDSKRLNKQRVECKQIYAALTGVREMPDGTTLPAIGWRSHPAVKMWRGAESLLCMYAYYVSLECTSRGIADHARLTEWFRERTLRHPFTIPQWMTDEQLYNAVRLSHQSNLIRKDPGFYAPQFPDIPDNLLTCGHHELYKA